MKATVDLNLLNHPFWGASDPGRMRLVRVSEAFPPELNPFFGDGVVIRAAGIPGESPHSKWYMGREGILDGVRSGHIHEGTHIVEGTSGNTGNGMAITCNGIGVHCTLIMPGDTPPGKVDAMRVLGQYVHPELHFDASESPTAKARRLGAQEGWYNPDQYGPRPWNANSHYQYMAPQLFAQAGTVSLLFVPGGTMGTSIGLYDFASHAGYSTLVIPVLCAEGEEVPGARTLKKIERDVRNTWNSRFDTLEFGPRHESFLLSYLSWRAVPQMLGPSFGLGLYGALSFLAQHQAAGTLDQFREPDGRVQVVVFGPDDYRLYTPTYFSELTIEELSGATDVPLLERIGIES